MLQTIQIAREIHGPAKVARAIANMSPRAQEELSTLLPVSWCPLDTATEFHYSLASITGENVNVWHRAVARLAMERMFTTFWRLLIRFTSVEALVKRAGIIYARSYDVGEMSARLVEPGLVEVVVSGWPDIPEFELEGIEAAFEAVLHIADAKGASVLRVRKGDSVARFAIRFRP